MTVSFDRYEMSKIKYYIGCGVPFLDEVRSPKSGKQYRYGDVISQFGKKVYSNSESYESLKVGKELYDDLREYFHHVVMHFNTEEARCFVRDFRLSELVQFSESGWPDGEKDEFSGIIRNYNATTTEELTSKNGYPDIYVTKARNVIVRSEGSHIVMRPFEYESTLKSCKKKKVDPCGWFSYLIKVTGLPNF